MSFVLLGILNSQATGAVIPEPAFLSSAPVWFDAADATTITESGGSVSQWDNKGTGENFVQATSADQPTTGVSTLNGLNVLDFDADFFQTSNKTQWRFMHDGTKHFVAVVVKFGVVAHPGANYTVFSSNLGSLSRIGAFLGYQDGGTGSDRLGLDVTNGTTGSILLRVQDELVANQIFIYSDLRDPTNATAADRVDYFENNTQGTATNTETGGVTSADSTENFTFAALRESDGLEALVGQVAEFIVVSGADATETNRQTTVDYLNSKWGVF